MLPGPSVISRRRTCASGRTRRRATVRTGTVLAAQWLMPAHVDCKLHMIFSSCRVNRPGVTHSAFHLLSGPFPSVRRFPPGFRNAKVLVELCSRAPRRVRGVGEGFADSDVNTVYPCVGWFVGVYKVCIAIATQNEGTQELESEDAEGVVSSPIPDMRLPPGSNLCYPVTRKRRCSCTRSA